MIPDENQMQVGLLALFFSVFFFFFPIEVEDGILDERVHTQSISSKYNTCFYIQITAGPRGPLLTHYLPTYVPN